MHLSCCFYVSKPLFHEAQLDGLHAVINEVLPEWSRGLRAAVDEDSKNGIVVGRDGRLYDCMLQVASPKRGLGDGVLSGGYSGLSVILHHSDPTPPPNLNRLTIEVYKLLSVEGNTVSIWAREAFEAVVARLPVRYANARMRDEFAAKNLIDDETGVEAIGMNLKDSLPGLYWLNFFGAPYVDLIGRERLLTAPAFEVKRVNDGVLMALDASADAWQTSEYGRREEAVMMHLGKQYFFSRHNPTRQTVAPDFAAYHRQEEAE